MSNNSGIPLVDRAASHRGRTAVVDETGTYTYDALLDFSETIGSALLDGLQDLEEARVAFIIPPSFVYTAVLWGIWRAGGIGVPLCVSHPAPELEYVITDADAQIIVAHPDYLEMLHPVAQTHNRKLVCSTDLIDSTSTSPLPRLDIEAIETMIYRDSLKLLGLE